MHGMLQLTKVVLQRLGDQRRVGESQVLQRLSILRTGKDEHSSCSKFEGTTYRSRDVGTGNSLRGSIEVVECGGLDDLGDDFRTDTEAWR